MSTAHIPAADLVAIANKRWEAGNYQRTGGYSRAATLNAEADELEAKHGLAKGFVQASPQYAAGPAYEPGGALEGIEETGELPPAAGHEKWGDLFA